MRSDSYIKFLEKKEKRTILKLERFVFSHGHLSAGYRILKGLILGFALGNLLIQRMAVEIQYGLILLILMYVFAVIMIKFERRHFRRGDWKDAIGKACWILLFCIIGSSFVIIYASYADFMLVLSICMFFSSLIYSLE